MAEKEKPNLRATVGILVNGEHVAEGTVLAKSDFANKTDWQNLVFGFGDNPRLVETSDPVGVPKAEKAAMPGAAT